MVITAESGASKTDWIIDGWRIRTKGINFSVMSEEDISSVVACVANEVRLELDPSSASGVKVYFYGAGLVSDMQKTAMSGILEKFFPGASVECASDLLAAARALWGNGPGVVAILGTGSNSCVYNGSYITANVCPGGYILGDEGGGSALGRKFLADYIKGLVPEDVAESFREHYHLKYPDIVNAVYKSANPAGFLASFAPFIIETAADEQYMERLVIENLRDFITRSLLAYRHDGEILKTGVAGSVGLACSRWLQSLGSEYGIDFCKYISSPVESLADYHSGKASVFAPSLY